MVNDHRFSFLKTFSSVHVSLPRARQGGMEVAGPWDYRMLFVVWGFSKPGCSTASFTWINESVPASVSPKVMQSYLGRKDL